MTAFNQPLECFITEAIKRANPSLGVNRNMKRNYLIQIICLFLVLAQAKSFAKAIDESIFNFGAQAGLTVFNADLANSTLSNTLTGFTAGVFAEAPLIPGLIYLQPELNFIQKGADNAVFGTSGSTRLSYLEVPILAKAKLTLSSVKPFVIAGPSAAVMLSSSGPGAATNRLGSFDFGFDLGGGVAIATSERSELTFTVKEALGLINLDKGASQWKSNGLIFTLGYLF